MYREQTTHWPPAAVRPCNGTPLGERRRGVVVEARPFPLSPLPSREEGPLCRPADRLQPSAARTLAHFQLGTFLSKRQQKTHSPPPEVHTVAHARTSMDFVRDAHMPLPHLLSILDIFELARLEQSAGAAYARVRAERGRRVHLNASSCARLARAQRRSRDALKKGSIWAGPLVATADDAVEAYTLLRDVHRLVEPLRTAAPALHLSMRGYLNPEEQSGFQRLLTLVLALLADDNNAVSMSLELEPACPCSFAIDVVPKISPGRNLTRRSGRLAAPETAPADEFGGERLEKLCVYATQLWREIGACRRTRALRDALLVFLGLSPRSAPADRAAIALHVLRKVFAEFVDLRILDGAFLVVETHWPWFIAAPNACALVRHYVASAEKIRRERQRDRGMSEQRHPKRRKLQGSAGHSHFSAPE